MVDGVQGAAGTVATRTPKDATLEKWWWIRETATLMQPSGSTAVMSESHTVDPLVDVLLDVERKD